MTDKTNTTQTPAVNLESLAKMQTDYQLAMKENGKTAILAALQGLFEQFPELEAFHWRQYTPYFNDGDACVFHVRSIGARITGRPEDAGDYDDGYEDNWGLRESHPEIAEALGEFEKQADAIEEAFQMVFGDHCEVTVTRVGVEVESYEHD